MNYNDCIKISILDYLILEFINKRGECTVSEIKHYLQTISDVSRQTLHNRLKKLYQKDHYITQKYYSNEYEKGKIITKIYYVPTDAGGEFYEKTAKLISKVSA